jgi:uncharacterized protein YjiS (DUF1127 family)
MTHFAATCPDDGRNHRSLVSLVGATLVRALLWPSRVLAARRTLSELAGLSEYELRDIGLSRQDLVDFTARPLDEDPTPYLAQSREARARSMRHASGRA